MQSLVFVLSCKDADRSTSCIKRTITSYKNVLLSMLFQHYTTAEITFNTYNYIFALLNTNYYLFKYSTLFLCVVNIQYLCTVEAYR